MTGGQPNLLHESKKQKKTCKTNLLRKYSCVTVCEEGHNTQKEFCGRNFRIRWVLNWD